jgi:citrate lyase beta subunit
VTSARNPIRRSLVPTPANVEGMVEKARGFRVDVLMLDLEDGVPNTDDAKARARSVLGRALEASTFAAREKAIRINGPHTKWFMEDLAFVAGLDIETVVVPMVRDAQDVMVAERALTGFGAPESLGLMLLIETPAAVLNFHDIVKASQRTNGLIAGGLDYASETHALSIIPVGAASRSPLHDQDLLYMRQHVLAVARAYNLSALDAMRPKLISDLEAFEPTPRPPAGSASTVWISITRPSSTSPTMSSRHPRRSLPGPIGFWAPTKPSTSRAQLPARSPAKSFCRSTSRSPAG